jgi:hypothetical protein
VEKEDISIKTESKGSAEPGDHWMDTNWEIILRREGKTFRKRRKGKDEAHLSTMT